ncbi:MAG: DUF1330 domain-containing protein [Gammaproteobacteria bacterium]
MKTITYFFITTFYILLAGCGLNEEDKEAALNESAKRPAYLIISVNEIHPDKMGPYKKAVRPLAQKAGGTTLLGLSRQEDIEVLEGEWNYPGILLIERFESMDALKSFWYSEEYEAAKKLREGFAEANFFVAIEGKPLAK